MQFDKVFFKYVDKIFSKCTCNVHNYYHSKGQIDTSMAKPQKEPTPQTYGVPMEVFNDIFY